VVDVQVTSGDSGLMMPSKQCPDKAIAQSTSNFTLQGKQFVMYILISICRQFYCLQVNSFMNDNK
jgi:hypothetical protein